MHRGLAYPYHPEYFATEAWFWRGFVPWKLHGRATATLFPPWTLIPSGWTGISDAGVVSADRTVITYRFVYLSIPVDYAFSVSMQRTGAPGNYKASWGIKIPDVGPSWAVAFLDQGFPQRSVFCPGFPFFTPAPPYTPDTGPALEFRPALYAEGGSPWQN
jgi:hypothetical protein